MLGFVKIGDDDDTKKDGLRFRPTLDTLETREAPAVISLPDLYTVRSGRTLQTVNIPGIFGKFGGFGKNSGVLRNDFDDQVTPPFPGSNRFLGASLISNPVDVATGIPITTPFTFNANGAGSFTFRAPRNFNGNVRFSYQAFNPGGTLGAVTNVNITVTGPVRRIAIGADAGGSPRVSVYDSTAKIFQFDLTAYDPSFRGGVRVATADINGDNVDDIITAPGPGGGPNVRVFDGVTGRFSREFMAFDPSFRGGLNITTGDINGDDREEIIVGADAGGGPHVKAFAITETTQPTVINEFMAYDESFRGGVRVQVGDTEGNGIGHIITAPGFSGGPHVKIWDSSTAQVNTLIREFMSGDANRRDGLNIAVGDFNGDYFDDIALGTGSGNPVVTIRSGRDQTTLGTFVPGIQPVNPGLQTVSPGPQTSLLGSTGTNLFNAETTTSLQGNDIRPGATVPTSLLPIGSQQPGSLSGYTGGARIAVTYANRDDNADLIVVSGPNDFSRMRIYSGSSAGVLIDYEIFEGLFYGGLWAAGHY